MFDVIGFWSMATILAVYPIYTGLRLVSCGVLSRLKKHMGWVTWSDYPGYNKDEYEAQPYPHGWQMLHTTLFGYEWVRFFRGGDTFVSLVIVLALLLSGCEQSLINTTYIQRISMFSEHTAPVMGWLIATFGGWLVFDKGLAMFAKFSALIQKGEKK